MFSPEILSLTALGLGAAVASSLVTYTLVLLGQRPYGMLDCLSKSLRQARQNSFGSIPAIDSGIARRIANILDVAVQKHNMMMRIELIRRGDSEVGLVQARIDISYEAKNISKNTIPCSIRSTEKFNRVIINGNILDTPESESDIEKI